MDQLIEALAKELKKPREVTDRLFDHVWGTYEIDRDDVGAFLEEQLDELEDYEHELILSPLFTPKLEDQALFAELLGPDPVQKEMWPDVVGKLEMRPVTAQVVTHEGTTHAIVLREVVLERYVSLLRLEADVDASIWTGIQAEPFASEGSTFKAIVRRATWEREGRLEILRTYLGAENQVDLYETGDGLRFLGLVEDYKPRNLGYLAERVPQWEDALRKELEEGDRAKPFFHEQIKENHGFDRDQRQLDETQIQEKQDHLAFLGRLLKVLPAG